MSQSYAPMFRTVFFISVIPYCNTWSHNTPAVQIRSSSSMSSIAPTQSPRFNEFVYLVYFVCLVYLVCFVLYELYESTLWSFLTVVYVMVLAPFPGPYGGGFPQLRIPIGSPRELRSDRAMVFTSGRPKPFSLTCQRKLL